MDYLPSIFKLLMVSIVIRLYGQRKNKILRQQHTFLFDPAPVYGPYYG